MLSESSSKKIKGQTSDIIYKIGRYIKKKQIDKRTIDEFFYVDRKGTGLLSEKDIDNAFRNAGVKLRSTDFTELMNSMDQKGNGTYDYVQLLVALFGNTPDIKRKADKLKRSDDRGEDTKRQLNYNNEDRRLRESKESNRSDRKRKSSRSRDGSRRGSVSSRGDSPRSRGRDDTRSRER